MEDMLINQITPARNSMNLFRKLIDFLEGNAGSLRFGVARSRLHDDLHYMTIADSKKELRNDFRRLRRDFYKTVNASGYGEKSRTEQD